MTRQTTQKYICRCRRPTVVNRNENFWLTRESRPRARSLIKLQYWCRCSKRESCFHFMLVKHTKTYYKTVPAQSPGKSIQMGRGEQNRPKWKHHPPGSGGFGPSGQHYSYYLLYLLSYQRDFCGRILYRFYPLECKKTFLLCLNSSGNTVSLPWNTSCVRHSLPISSHRH